MDDNTDIQAEKCRTCVYWDAVHCSCDLGGPEHCEYEPFEDSVFTIIHIEGFCLRRANWESKSSKYVYELTEDGRFIQQDNPDYTPELRIPPRPSFCPHKPTFICLFNDCPHFAYAEHDPCLEEQRDTPHHCETEPGSNA